MVMQIKLVVVVVDRCTNHPRNWHLVRFDITREHAKVMRCDYMIDSKLHPPPVTRHLSPVTRHPPPVTRGKDLPVDGVYVEFYSYGSTHFSIQLVYCAKQKAY